VEANAGAAGTIARRPAARVAAGGVLLAHHGTAGAALAERRAWRIAAAANLPIVHLYVVPDFWAGMQGDDWLNNAWTRDAFAAHLEGHLEAEAKAQLQAVAAGCAERGFPCEPVLRVGDPTDCLIKTATEYRAAWVVIGPPRAKGVPGYRCRVDLERLVRGLRVPLVVAQGE